MDKVIFYKVDYSDASQQLMSNLFQLRKEVFADRLDWRVIVN